MSEEAKRIVEDIFSSLNGNEEDIDFLNIKKEKYASHPRASNILDKILIKEKEYLGKENKEAYDSMMKTYVESVDYGINLANEYFQKRDIDNTKKILETLIKSFSSSYINDEFGNCVYFSNGFERELYKYIYKDYRPVFECLVNKGYVYYMYGRVLLESNKVNEALLSFDLAKTYSPFLMEAYFFKALLLKVHKKFEESREELMKAHKYIYKNVDLADFYYFVGNYRYKFINKEYEYLMYQKSYSLHPNTELYLELKEMKPVDRELELNEDEFSAVCKAENIPPSFDEILTISKEEVLKENNELEKFIN